jgi:hypothetical protein
MTPMSLFLNLAPSRTSANLRLMLFGLNYISKNRNKFSKEIWSIPWYGHELPEGPLL